MAASITEWANAVYAVAALAAYLGFLYWYYRREINAWLKARVETYRERQDETARLNAMWEGG